MTTKKLLIISSAIFVGSAIFFVHSRTNRIDKYLAENLRIFCDLSEGRLAVLYFVNNVNPDCRSFPRMRELYDQEAKIFIFVESDYSNQDINNLRDAFKFPLDINIQRMGVSIRTIRNKCVKQFNNPYLNFCFIISPGGEIIELRAF